MSDDIAYMPVTELVERFRAKSLSPVEATRAAFDRIAAHDGKTNAYCHLDEAGALKSAAESEARWAKGAPVGRLDGVPLSVKDTLHAKGMPTRWGSKTTSDAPEPEDTSPVASVRRHGAVILGKTTCPEFALGPVTISPLTGITRNPWDLDKTSGGSSGGACAAVAAGLGNAALGSDAGGSIRVPSALCGVVGLKATWELVPSYPSAVNPSISCLGPITRTVADAALLLTVMCEPDWRDWQAMRYDGTDYAAALAGGVKGMKIAFSPTFRFAEKVDSEVAALVAAAARAFADLGATVEEADPGFDDPIDILLTCIFPNVARRFRDATPEQLETVNANIRQAIERGQKIELANYIEAQERRAELGKHLQHFHETYDLLLTPTVAVPAFSAERWVPEEFEGHENARAWIPFCNPFNLSGQPAISVPCGFTAAGLPVGLQVVGPRFGDAAVLRAAHAYEAVNPVSDRRPSL